MSHVLTPSPAYPLVSATVPDDGDDANAASVQVGFQPHDNSIATLAARIGNATDGSAEWAFADARSRSNYIPITGGRAGLYYVDDTSDVATLLTATQAQQAGWRQKAVVTTGAHPPRDTVDEQFTMKCGLTYQNYTIDVPSLYQGVTVQSVSCRVIQGFGETDASRRILVHFYKRNIATDTITDLGSATFPNSSSGTGTIVLTLGSPELLATNTYSYHVVVRSGASPAESGTPDDELLGCLLTFTEPGPRHG